MLRLRSALLPALSLSVVLLSFAACGGDPVCGNGVKETGEDCDHGAKNGTADDNCSASCRSISIPRIELRASWSLLTNAVPGYRGTTCTSVGAASAHLVISGAIALDETLPCADGQEVISTYCATPPDGGTCTTRLPAGDYQATVTLLDAQGQPVTKPVSSPMTTAVTGTDTNLVAAFTMSDFLRQDYTGAVLFTTTWGDSTASCERAQPPVDHQAFTLVDVDRNPIAAGTKTDQGSPLDGSEALCFTPTGAQVGEKVSDLPWGPYTLTVVGSSQGTTAYCGQFSLFVGPGDTNRAFSVVVPAASIDDGAGAGCP